MMLRLCRAAVMIASLTAMGQTADELPAKNMGLDLRNAILSTVPAWGWKDACAVVMDIYQGNDIASVMSSSDGGASVYYRSGGAIVGGLPNIENRAASFASMAWKNRALMQRVDEYPYPAKGNVRFYLRTRDGVFAVEVPESELESGKHELSRLFKAGKRVLDQFESVRRALKR